MRMNTQIILCEVKELWVEEAQAVELGEILAVMAA